MAIFIDRRHGGCVLAEALATYAHREDVIVLALPRGGVPVGYEVARALALPLDVFVVRKLGVPHNREFAMGAIASGGAIVLNEDVIDAAGVTPCELACVVREEAAELARRERAYRGHRPALELANKTVILVDDGLATGSTMRAALAGLRALRPAAIVIGVPVSSPSTCEVVGAEVDRIVCAVTPHRFFSVGAWYEDFSQTSDDEVRELLAADTQLSASETFPAGL